MSVAVVTGAAGLIGSESALHFGKLGLDIVGIDNDMRAQFFGREASTEFNRRRMEATLGHAYTHHYDDIRNRDQMFRLFKKYGESITLIIHTAAQPSHDWAARDPLTDFDINAVGTLNLLEAVRRHAPSATFIFTSTNKVYGDKPNFLPMIELETRWEIEEGHEFSDGISESMSIDKSLHSVFGASKVAADIMVQEYGRYFDMPTACFRAGTLTGPKHAGTELHGFLAYVMRCVMTQTPYQVFGYKGKQVRDAMHSLDLVAAFEQFFREPRIATVYNIGGGRISNSSVLEAISSSEQIAGLELSWTHVDAPRVGDHIWWIGSNRQFQQDFPEWELTYDVESILREIYEANFEVWK